MGSSSSGSEHDRKHRKHKKKDKKSKKAKKEKKIKKDKKRKHQRRSSSVSSGSESDEWVEALPGQMKTNQTDSQTPHAKLEREDWMNSMLIPTYSKEPKKEPQNNAPSDRYDPKTSVRELNPYWKNGGSGLPSFRKPVHDEDEDDNNDEPYISKRMYTERQILQGRTGQGGGWKKAAKAEPQSRPVEQYIEVKPAQTIIESKTTQNEIENGLLLTDEQLNDLGAKIIKAELLGNTTQAASLKEKLEKAKAYRRERQLKKESNREIVHKRRTSIEEPVTYTVGKSYNETQRSNMKKQKQYQRNLPPGPDLSDKFRSERHDNDNMDTQFFNVSSKMGEGKRLENIFDHQRASSAVGETNAAEERTVREMNRISKAQEDCERCINSGRFAQEQLIAMGKSVYLAIPAWRALQPKHCFIVPVGHYASLTQVDEDVHQEILEVCKALVQMFRKYEMEVIFFETVRYLHRNPHMYIQCVPAKNYEMAPFYFKKAILESETEWAMNKKLHNVDGLNVKRTIPKNLPYFWVNFNLENGFAHVIEDQELFPVTFATETIAGILGLDTRDWRKPRKELYPAQKVEEFKKWWLEFDAVLRNE